MFLLDKHLQSSLFSLVLSSFTSPVAAIHSMNYPFFYYKRVITATHSFKFTVFLKNRNFSKAILTMILIPPWFQACIIMKKVCYMTSFTAIHFFYDSIIISLEHLKQSTYQGNCLYFTILFATIHYNKRSAVDSRKS